MVEGRLPKIALKWMPKQKRARGRRKKNWMEVIRKAMNERNLNEGQWEDRKQWSLGVGQRGKAFWNRYIYIYLFIYLFWNKCDLNVRKCKRRNVELANIMRSYCITSKFIPTVNVEHISWKLPTDLTEFKSPSFPNKLKHRIAGWETEREFWSLPVRTTTLPTTGINLDTF